MNSVEQLGWAKSTAQPKRNPWPRTNRGPPETLSRSWLIETENGFMEPTHYADKGDYTPQSSFDKVSQDR